MGLSKEERNEIKKKRYANKYKPIGEREFEAKPYAGLREVFNNVRYKTWFQGETLENYIKKSQRSDHPLAFSRKQMRLVTRVFFEKLMERLLKADAVKTPIGTFFIATIPAEVKVSSTGKVFNQLDMNNRTPFPYVVNARFSERQFMRFVFTKYYCDNGLYPFLKKHDYLINQFIDFTDKQAIQKAKASCYAHYLNTKEQDE